MSQVTEQSVRFQTALASIKLIQASAVLDLTEDDFDFLTSNKVWIATDRSRAQIGRAVQQECRDRSRMPSSARKKKFDPTQQSKADPRVMIHLDAPLCKRTHLPKRTNRDPR